jgi:hypothetical protein
MQQPGGVVNDWHSAPRRSHVAALMLLTLTASGPVSSLSAAPRPSQPAVPQSPAPLPPRPPVDLTPHDFTGSADYPSKADYAAGTRPDQIGRIIVNVMVNQQGPFQFALDTGANRSVLTPHLVLALSLPTDDGDAVKMNGVTGSAEVPTALVERVAAGDLTLVRQRLPVADSLTSGIDGILGVDGLSSKRILVDFTKNRIEIRNSRFEHPLEGIERVPAQVRFGRLMVIEAYVDGVRVKAVIDTGSQHTLGNEVLRAALLASPGAPLQNSKIDVVGETLITQQGERHVVQRIKVGGVSAVHFNVVFGEFYVFKLWNLETQPALVIGMDIIGNLDSFVIDYARCEVQLVGHQQGTTAGHLRG